MLAFAFTLVLLCSLAISSSASSLKKNGAHHARNARHSIASRADKPLVLGAFFNDWSDTDLNTASFQSLSEVDFFVAETTNSVDTVSFSNGEEEEPYIHDFVKRVHASGSTALVTLGGWTGSVYFSKLIATPANRTAFAKTLAQLVRQYDFDGLDVDWEYPNNEGAGNYFAPDDTENLYLMLKELRNDLGPNKRIVADVTPLGFQGPDGGHIVDASRFAEVLDYVLIMAFENSGPWTSLSGPNAPLYSSAAPEEQATSVASGFEYWISAGFPAHKILLGAPSFAKSFHLTSRTLAETTYNGVSSYAYQTYTTAEEEEYTYAQLVDEGYVNATGFPIKGNGFTRYWDTPSMTPFLFNPTTKQYITYDDPVSIAAKAKFVVEKGMGGLKFYDYQGLTKALVDAVNSVFKA